MFFKVLSRTIHVFLGGAAVAQLPVKELVVGSNPTRGAINKIPHIVRYFVLQVEFSRGRILPVLLLFPYFFFATMSASTFFGTTA